MEEELRVHGKTNHKRTPEQLNPGRPSGRGEGRPEESEHVHTEDGIPLTRSAVSGAWRALGRILRRRAHATSREARPR